jgi:hypothetical protein
MFRIRIAHLYYYDIFYTIEELKWDILIHQWRGSLRVVTIYTFSHSKRPLWGQFPGGKKKGVSAKGATVGCRRHPFPFAHFECEKV